MALVVKDRVRETTTTLGTGTVTLAGAVAGFQSFSAIGNANTTYYTINLPGANEWEVGIGTYTASGTTLSRDTVLASSNGGSLVSFSAGTKDVFCTYPAGRSVYYDTSTNVTLNALTLSGGTANGVLYLDGSKVATTGSALTFDGANVVLVGASLYGTYRASGAGGGGGYFETYNNTGTRLGSFGSENGGDMYLGTRVNNPIIFLQNNTEQMRLTTTGLGIGTSSPFSKLTVSRGGSAGAVSNFTDGLAQGLVLTTGTGYFGFYNPNYGAITFRDGGNAIENMRLTDSGNLGLGVTPSAWGGSGVRALDIGTAAALAGSGSDAGLIANAYYNGTNWIYKTSSLSVRYQQIVGTGTHAWFNAPSGTANTTTITNGVSYTIITSGNQTDFGAANNNVGTVFTATSGGTLTSGTVSQNISFTQAMTLDASGNLGLGTTNPAYKLDINTTANSFFTGIQVRNISNGSSAVASIALGQDTNLTSSAIFVTSSTNTGYGGANSFNIFQGLNAPMAFFTNGSERARITSGGDFIVGFGTTQVTTVKTGAAIGFTNTANTSSFDVGLLGGASDATAYVYQRANSAMVFATNNTERARITSSGTFQTSLDASIYGVTVGRGAGAVSTNTAVGASALAANTTGATVTAIGFEAAKVNTTGDGLFAGYRAGYANTTGYNLAAVGTQALFGNTTGVNNTALGTQALLSNTTASNNTAVGYQAGYSNTTGDQLTFIGTAAGYSNTTGQITALGYGALYANTSGNYSTAVGNTALRFNTTGADNVAIGHTALYSNTTASNNTAVGYQAGYSNTTATFNTSVGSNALRATTTGEYNVAVGGNALLANTTGGENVAIGLNSLVSNTTGSFNSAIGRSALNSNTTASNNTAVGFQAGYNTTTGSYNAFIGRNAGYGTTAVTGTENTALGNSALVSISSGNYNVAIGAQALLTSQTASYNTAVGYTAGYSNTTGSVNVSVGYRAGYSNTTGLNNIFIGAYAGEGVGASTITGNGNTAVGASAGASLTTGTYNTFVGAAGQVNQGSGGLITTGSKNTILGPYNGNQGGLDIRTLSNRIVLSDGDGNPRWYIDNTGASGYGPSTGGAVTQATSRTTGVTLDKPTGAITLVSAAGTTSWQSFTVTNNTVAATDTVIVNQKSGTDLYQIFVTNVAAGSFQITFATTGGTTTEQPVFNFALIKGQTA